MTSTLPAAGTPDGLVGDDCLGGEAQRGDGCGVLRPLNRSADSYHRESANIRRYPDGVLLVDPWDECEELFAMAVVSAPLHCSGAGATPPEGDEVGPASRATVRMQRRGSLPASDGQ